MLDELPAYVYGDCCGERHYLTLSKDIQGKWSAAYVDCETGEALDGLWLNNASTIDQAAEVLTVKLARWRDHA